MKETKFTKGVWKVLPLEDKPYIRVRGTTLGEKFKIANVDDSFHHHDGSNWCARERLEALANAHLIAAAPEMYRMLEEDIRILKQQALQYVVGSYELRSINLRIQTKQELLTKARGE